VKNIQKRVSYYQIPAQDGVESIESRFNNGKLNRIDALNKLSKLGDVLDRADSEGDERIVVSNDDGSFKIFDVEDYYNGIYDLFNKIESNTMSIGSEVR
jgi:hypothetical protein